MGEKESPVPWEQMDDAGVSGIAFHNLNAKEKGCLLKFRAGSIFPFSIGNSQNANGVIRARQASDRR